MYDSVVFSVECVIITIRVISPLIISDLDYFNVYAVRPKIFILSSHIYCVC
jgi:hypothetical protein